MDRIMKMPDGGILNVDVSLLQLGLSQCRSIAEDTLCNCKDNTDDDYIDAMNRIIDMVVKTLHEIDVENMTPVNEVNSIKYTIQQEVQGE
jgi:hypothetical protein